MTHIFINPSIRVRGLFENAQRVCGLHREDETCGCGWGARSAAALAGSAEPKSGSNQRTGPQKRGSSALYSCAGGGVQCGDKNSNPVNCGSVQRGWRCREVGVSFCGCAYVSIFPTGDRCYRGTYALFCSRSHLAPTFSCLLFLLYARYSFININLTLSLILVQ